MILLAELLRRYWLQAGVAITVAGLLAGIGYQKHELTAGADKLATAAKLHAEDQQSIADLGKELADQNDAVSALQAQQATKQAEVTAAVAKVKTQQQKVVTCWHRQITRSPAPASKPCPTCEQSSRGSSNEAHQPDCGRPVKQLRNHPATTAVTARNQSAGSRVVCQARASAQQAWVREPTG